MTAPQVGGRQRLAPGQPASSAARIAALRIENVVSLHPPIHGHTIVSCAMADAPRVVRTLRMHAYRNSSADGRHFIILYVARGDDGSDLSGEGVALLEAAGDVRIVTNYETSLS